MAKRMTNAQLEQAMGDSQFAAVRLTKTGQVSRVLVTGSKTDCKDVEAESTRNALMVRTEFGVMFVDDVKAVA